jgi:DNA-binding NtrC family response regulator
MTTAAINEALHEASLAIQNAQEVRAYHRKRSQRGDTQREADLEMAIERVRDAMRPLRSEIGRFPHQAQSATVEARQGKIRAASTALQRERRKLWKMMDRPIERTP